MPPEMILYIGHGFCRCCIMCFLPQTSALFCFLFVPIGEESWKVIYKQEADALSDLLRKCENQNEFIWREKPPRPDELPVLEGKQIVSPVTYHSSMLDRDFIFVI